MDRKFRYLTPAKKNNGRPLQTPPANAHPLIKEVSAAIIARGCTQESVAKVAGLNSKVITEWRLGRRMPKIDDFVAFANTLGFEVVLRKLEP